MAEEELGRYDSIIMARYICIFALAFLHFVIRNSYAQFAGGSYAGSKWGSSNLCTNPINFAAGGSYDGFSRASSNLCTNPINFAAGGPYDGFAPQGDVCGIPLPIELSFFSASCEEKIITLKWSTASEVNNNYFTLERTFDLLNFEVIGSVPAKTNSSSSQGGNYKFEDSNLPNLNSGVILYYRLKQTDHDGRFKYFIPIACSCTDDKYNISISPNPAFEKASLQYRLQKNEENARIEFYDLPGKLVKDYYLSPEKESLLISLTDLSASVYLYRVIVDYTIVYVGQLGVVK